MGIDLSFYVEIRTSQGWWMWQGGIRPKKGDRLDEDYFIPRNHGFYNLFERRGRPEDLSDVIRNRIRKSWGEPPEATISWITYEELIQLAPRVRDDLKYIYDPLVAYLRKYYAEPENLRLILEFY